MEKQILEAMQRWMDNRDEIVDTTIDNIDNEAERGNEKAQMLQKLDKSALRKATNEAINKKSNYPTV